jgi:hypothetical protein
MACGYFKIKAVQSSNGHILLDAAKILRKKYLGMEKTGMSDKNPVQFLI